MSSSYFRLRDAGWEPSVSSYHYDSNYYYRPDRANYYYYAENEYEKFCKERRERFYSECSKNLESAWKQICQIPAHFQGLQKRAITQLDVFDTKIDTIASFAFQDKMDELGVQIQNKIDNLEAYIEKKFVVLPEFNRWLDATNQGNWFQQLAAFLCKLPPRAARNVIRLLVRAIKTAYYAAVHPLKALNQLAKTLVLLINELTKAQTWSTMGAGMMSASLGQALASGNPLSLIGIGIGGAMFIGGLSVGALQAALRTERKDEKAAAAIKQVWEQIKPLPESMLTSFFIGLLIGGIQRCFQKDHYVPNNPQGLNQIADQFIHEHNLPPFDLVYQNANGDITICWWANENSAIMTEYAHLFPKPSSCNYLPNDLSTVHIPVSLEVVVQPNHTQFYTSTWINDGYEGYLSKVPVKV
jgi:hypothetical protein